MNKEISKNLFIIGNGFDIAHGIPSKYSDFHKFLRSLYMTEKHVEMSYSSFDRWRYSVPRTDGLLGRFDGMHPHVFSDILGFLDYCISRSQNRNQLMNFYINSDWWSIEEVLGDLDLREYFHDSDEGLLDEENDAESLLYDIAECFKYLRRLAAIWASKIDVSNVTPLRDFAKLINRDRLLPINNDFFLTFNYTATLEECYGVKEVIHVHGIAGGAVLLGHDPGIDVDQFCKTNSIPECSRHAAQVLLEVTCKDTNKRVAQISDLVVQKCAGVTDIYSYGFSFADVDTPYIELICKAIDTENVIWHLLDFDPPEKRKCYMDKTRGCGYEGKFSTYHVESSISKGKKTNQ